MSRDSPTSSADAGRDDRTVRAYGQTAVDRLQETAVAVTGVGGVGSIIAVQLARLGVDRLVLIDPDTVEESNLPRVAGSSAYGVGEPKVDAVALHVGAAAPQVDVDRVQHRVEDAPDALWDVDFVVAGVDRVSARIWLTEYCVDHALPYVDAGSVIHADRGAVTMRGYVQTVLPGETGCLDCMDRLDRERARLEQMSEEEVEEQMRQGYVPDDFLEPEPAVIHLNGVVASLAVQQVVAVVVPNRDPTGLIRYDADEPELTAMETTPVDRCPICGDGGDRCR